ncbi:MAG TPA: hypothetical protein VHX87_05985 [Galbitalea sp.]|nr:hypothetical protein [Galbitalea sp.]
MARENGRGKGELGSNVRTTHPGAVLDEYLGDVGLGELIGTSAELWLGMQTSYDLWVARSHPRPRVLPLAS